MEYLGARRMSEPQNVVTEFIEGLVESYPRLQYLDGFPQVKVVIRADVSSSTYDKVAIISGGGSGHEPAHAGFVGEGMLTAAICGDIFATPPVDAILAGIRAVTGPKGCLLIVMNYSSDRLNFGLAAEEAKSEGYKIETLIVGDDCAVTKPRILTGRRGLAGAILVQKVAGAAAAAGLSLTSVAAEAKSVVEKLGTMMVAFSGCILPGYFTPERVVQGKMEIGAGINGDPGISVADILPVEDLVPHILAKILSLETNFAPIRPGSRVVALVNGLGATTMMDLMIAAGKVAPNLMLRHGLAVARVYTGSFMTSLSMTGFSISLMRADSAVLQRLDAPTTAPAWPVGVDGSDPPPKIPVRMPRPPAEKSLSRPLQLNEQGQTLEAAIVAAANAMIDMKGRLNDLDGVMSDGDCGSNMCKGAKAILEDIQNYPLNDAAETANEIALSLGRVMGKKSGLIHSIFFKAAYVQLKRCRESSAISAKEWAQTLASSTAAVSKHGGALAGYRTSLDALLPALSVLQERLKGDVDPCTAFVASSEAAIEGAKSTQDMLEPDCIPFLETEDSSYMRTIRNKLLSTFPDPGAMAAASWYRAAALAVKERHEAASSSSS